MGVRTRLFSMSNIIAFFRLLAALLYNVNQYLLSPFGFITSVATSVWSLFSFVNSDWFNCMSSLVSYLSGLPNLIHDALEEVAQSTLFTFLYQFFALEVFSECMLWCFALVIGIAIFSVFEVFFATVLTVVPLFILKTVRQLISVASAGLVKP